MWSGQPSELYRRRAGQDEPNVDIHNIRDSGGPFNTSEVVPETQPATTETSSTAVSEPKNPAKEDNEGTWGERDVGGPVNQATAMEDYEHLRQTLSQVSRTRSRSSVGTEGGRGLFRAVTSRSKKSGVSRRHQTRSTEAAASDEEDDLEANERAEIDEKEEEFQLGDFLREGHFEKRNEAGDSTKKVGVSFKHLTVRGLGQQMAFVRTLPDALLGTFGPDLYRIISSWVPVLRFGNLGPTRILINDFTGVVRAGEIMLVLGRPGSGCSTFLKAIANSREAFAGVTGDVSYGGISAEKQKEHYRGDVAYNPEDDLHLPALNVWQTLRFSLLNKLRKSRKGEINIIVDALLKMFGISHTSHTLVGNEYVRGVSGGERKRVSIAETLTTQSTVVCWDNSTRGLDASTALDYAKSLRVMTDVSGRTTIVTLYQAGESIFDLMDKVMVIDEGRMIYQGPASEAKQYFINLGFECPERMTSADFLTSVTDPNERRIRKGYENQAPRTAADLERAFKSSSKYQMVLADVERYHKEIRDSSHADAEEFKRSVREQKSKTIPKSSSYSVSFFRQVMACTLREFWLIWGDKTTLKTKFFIIISNALIVSSLFYDQPADTEGAFSRGGTLFFSILFLGWLQLSELMKAVTGRVVIARHRDYAFYNPAAVIIARVLTDIPMIAIQVLPFSLIMYFMTNLDRTASKYFINILFIYITTLCITALYRMFAALSPSIDDAVRFSGISLNLLVIYTGYVIPKPDLLSQKIWFGWLYYINPMSYSFEAVLTNEFAGRIMSCGPAQLVPQGPDILPAYQGCAFTGAQLGNTSVTGDQYLSTSFEYTRHHLWRNFGVVIAFTALYVLITTFASEVFSFVGGGGGSLVFKKSKKTKRQLKRATKDEETASKVEEVNSSSEPGYTSPDNHGALQEISGSSSVFTFQNVEYTIPYQNSERKLLNKISGFAKPGVMVALMGASGAGKTTLLNTLAQRQKMGVVSGEMLVDGRQLTTGFQRATGFCEQMDLHDGTATIREALEFSAVLRQERQIPYAEKIAYVDKIIDLLELGDLQDAIVMSLGVEQRKRLTIGVELAAKPSLLLFLDEPTSGLDSQSAYSIVRFLKKLAQAGQAIICTIHQPSSILVQQFDMILALNPGGNTFYFGPVGENGSAVIKYFADRGAVCPPSKNVAEFILETAAKPGRGEDGKRINWNKEWRDSAENQGIFSEIARIHSIRSEVAPPLKADQHEYAAPVSLQTKMLSIRLFTQYWRSPSYYYGKIFVSVIVGIFNGFTFWQLGNTVQDMENRMFTSFLIIMLPPTLVNSIVPKFYQNRSLWEFREYPSRIYNFVAFCTASIITEIPIAIISSVIYWALWYFATGLSTDSSAAGYVFLMTMLFFIFTASWGQWICAFAPSFTVISNVLPFFFVVFSLFNGVIRPYSQLNVFWKSWVYWMNPSTYWIGGVMSATLPGIPVQCAPQEAAYFNPPPGQTCEQYAGSFVQSVGSGYLTNPDATSACGYCAYRDGTEYMATLNVKPSDKWRYFGIFLAFCISNWILVYALIYACRVRGWSFGLGYVSTGVSKITGLIEDGVRKMLPAKKKGETKA